MNISDLKYLRVVDVNSDIFGAGGTNFNTNVKKNVDIKKKVDFNIKKDVKSKVDIKGNLATAQASADALGNNTLTEIDLFTQTTDKSSESFGESLSATR